MLRPDLTSEVARQEIGEVLSEQHLTFFRNSVYVRLVAIRRRICEEFGCMPEPELMKDPSEREKMLRIRSLYIRERQRIINGIFLGEFRKYGHSIRNVDEDGEIVDLIALRGTFREILDNVIEHGSVCCSAGNVEVSISAGTHGVMTTFRQPLSGIDYGNLYGEVLKERVDFSYGNEEFPRGCGINRMVNKRMPWVWGQALPDGSFLTTILETRTSGQIEREYGPWNVSDWMNDW